MSVDWAQLYSSMYEDLVRFLYRKVWDSDRAQDLAQETFVRCMRERASEISNARAFVFAVAVNLAKDEVRSVLRRKKHLQLLASDALATGNAAEPADALERAQKIARVEAALAELAERDRDVLLLWDAGLSYQEIAQQTGLAIGAIGTTLARARRRLVEAYDESERQRHVAHR